MTEILLAGQLSNQATTSGFIQVACSRVQPRKVTIEKKDEINEYNKK
jgi:hypothetical protein